MHTMDRVCLKPTDEKIEMNGKASRTNMKEQELPKDTFYGGTKRFFHKASRNIRSLLLRGYAKLPKNPLDNSIFSGSNKIGPRLQETDSSCRSTSQRWDPGEVVNKKWSKHALKEQANGDGQSSKGSTSASDHSRLEDLKEEKTRKRLQGEQAESSFLATENFAQKMEELEMMNVNDGKHVLDIDEVVHCYSLLTSPAYLDIVDKFSMDVYQELNLPLPSRSDNDSIRRLNSSTTHSSMRKLHSTSIHSSTRNLGSATVHSSLRKMGCSTSVHTTSVHTSMREVGSVNVHSSTKKLSSISTHSSKRKLGSDSLHGSMRILGSDSLHGSMKKIGSDSVHGSMRKLGSASIDSSLRKLGSDSIYGSMRKLGSDSIHGSMRKLGSDSTHGSMRKLGSESVHGSMRKLGSVSVHGSMRKLGTESIHCSMRKLGRERVPSSMRKLGSDSIHSSMRCLPSKAIRS